MTVTLTKRADINLDTFLAVAWKRSDVRISEAALDRIAHSRAAFLKLIDSDPPPVIYGVTTAMGELASVRQPPSSPGPRKRKPATASTPASRRWPRLLRRRST